MSPELRVDLGRRIAFTLGALLVYRIGTYIPLPGIDPPIWERLFRARAEGIGDGGIHRLAIFALDISPYVSAAIIVQLFSLFFRRVGPRSGKRYVLGLTAVFTALQALNIAVAIERVSGVVADPGWLFRISTVLSLTGGTFFLVWLSELITVRGVGNGLALFLFVGVVTELPAGIVGILNLERQGVVSTDQILFIVGMMVAVVTLIVFMELARRHIPIQFVRRQVGGGAIESQPSILSLKINNAGAIPFVFASWFLSVQILIDDFARLHGPAWLSSAVNQFSYGRPGFEILAAILIVFFALLYTALLLDPERTAERLTRYGGVVPGVMPGDPTAEHFDHVLSRTAFVGAVYLAVLYILPGILLSHLALPFYFSGFSVLILVCTVLDIDTQVRGDGLMKARGIRQ